MPILFYSSSLISVIENKQLLVLRYCLQISFVPERTFIYNAWIMHKSSSDIIFQRTSFNFHKRRWPCHLNLQKFEWLCLEFAIKFASLLSFLCNNLVETLFSRHLVFTITFQVINPLYRLIHFHCGYFCAKLRDADCESQKCRWEMSSEKVIDNLIIEIDLCRWVCEIISSIDFALRGQRLSALDNAFHGYATVSG